MRLPLTINGEVFSNAANKYEYQVSYIREGGGHDGIMQDGSETVDTLTIKAQLSIPANSLTRQQLQRLSRLLLMDYVTVTYFDTATNGERTAEFIGDLEACQPVLYLGEQVYWDGAVISLRERTGRSLEEWQEIS